MIFLVPAHPKYAKPAPTGVIKSAQQLINKDSVQIADQHFISPCSIILFIITGQARMLADG
jgi:hypothetical protein